jgi:hypothetical protein
MSAELFVPDATWSRKTGSERSVQNLRLPQRVIPLVQQSWGSAGLWHQFGLVAVFVLLLTGCTTVEKYSLTYRLWDNGDLRKWSEPAPNPNLALFEATNAADVLVQYDALKQVSVLTSDTNSPAQRQCDMKLYSRLLGWIGILTKSCVSPQVFYGSRRLTGCPGMLRGRCQRSEAFRTMQ